MKNGFVIYQSNEGTGAELEIFVNSPSEKANKAVESGSGIRFNSSNKVPPYDELRFIKIVDGKIEYDPLAIRKEAILNLRERRNAALEELDKACLRYITDHDHILKIEEYRQILRDLPERVSLESINTPADAGHISPPELILYKELL